MKCFVHVGLDPKPKEVDTAVEAIALAESILRSWDKEAMEEGDEPLSVKWRRDELYPDNFTDYTTSDLLEALQEKGEVTLQLAAYGADGLPIMGDIADIVTESKERENVAEAAAALQDLDKSLAASYNTKVTLISGGVATTFSKDGDVATKAAPKMRKRRKTLKGRKPAKKVLAKAGKATPKAAKKPVTKKKTL
jgi:hypothetical protein